MSINVFNTTTSTATASKEVNPTRLTVGRVSVQATKEGSNFECLTLIIDRKLTINKPLKGIIDIVKADVFSQAVTEEAKQAVNGFVAKYTGMFSL